MYEFGGRWLIRQINRTPAHLLVAGFIAHLAGARLAAHWDFRGENIIPLWPAVGLVVGISLVSGRRWWLVVLGGALGDVANIALFETEIGLRFAAIAISAQLFQNSIAASFGQRLVSPPESARRAVRTIRLVLFGSVAAAAIGACYVALLGDFDNRLGTARDWFVGDSLGYLVGAPAIYSLSTHWIGGRLTKLASIELIISLSLVAAITVVGFTIDLPLALLAIPGTSWLAVRFGIIASAPMVLFVAAWGTWRTSVGDGPFASIDNPLVTSQYFTASVALAGVFIAAQAVQADREHRRLAGLVRTLPDAILVIDDDGMVVDDYTTSIRGEGPLAGKSIHELVTDDSVQQVDLALAILKSNGRSTATTQHLSVRSGRARWYETKLVQIAPDRALAVGRDITDRLHVDAELRSHAYRWRELMNASFQGLAEINADGTVEAANSRFASTLGLQTNDVLRRHLNELMTDELWPTWSADYPELREGKRISQQISRDSRSGVIAVLPQIDNAGEFTGAIAISLDTT